MLVLTVGLNLWGGMGWAGTLEPPASAVDASGNPVATGDLHSWDKKLNAANGPQTGRLAGCFSERFTCIFPDENGNYTAVRDNETGL
ncbi:MAG: hypothetical protein OEY57_14130, partial [Nitrospirota bacterium]|nr:hypothetical protein [Nitrospirota bacterium]